MENLKVREEVEFIKATIENSKKRFADNGLHYIVWGILTACGCILTYFLSENLRVVGAAWIAVYAVGTVFSFGVAKRRKVGATNFLDRLVGNVWIAFLVSLVFLLVVAFCSPYISVRIIPVFPSVMLFVAFHITASAYQDKMLQAVAFCWLVASVIFSFWVSLDSLLVFAGLLILLQVVPGIALYKRNR